MAVKADEQAAKRWASGRCRISYLSRVENSFPVSLCLFLAVVLNDHRQLFGTEIQWQQFGCERVRISECLVP